MGLLKIRHATVVDLPPAAATFQALQNPKYLPAAGVEDGDELLRQLEGHFITTLYLALGSLSEIRVDFRVNEDDSLVVSISVPYQAVYEEQPAPTRAQNLEAFVDACCGFFLADTFFIGVVGEEADISGYDSLIGSTDAFADWAFYGAPIAAELETVVPKGTSTAKTWRRLARGGLFVRWHDWEAREPAPAFWRSSLGEILGRAVARVRSGEGLNGHHTDS